MGTRNLTCVLHDGRFKIAQYCQWDGYPRGVGAGILKFLKTPGNIEKLRAQIENCRFLSNREWDHRTAPIQADNGDISEHFPTLSRNMGPAVLEYVASSTDEVPLYDESDFALDSLMCEWAYVVDLDENEFHVYKGFNKDPNANCELFHKLLDKPREILDGTEYYPVKLVKIYNLDDLPSIEQLVAECGPGDEE